MCALAENLDTARSYLNAIEQGEMQAGLSSLHPPLYLRNSRTG
jgi:hypothetical protein